MRITMDELDTVRRSLFLTFLLDVLDNQLRKVKQFDSSIKPLHIKSTEVLMQRIHAELVQTRRQLKEAQIKVVQADPSTATLNYEIYCRGHSESFGMMKELVKAELGVMLNTYVTHLSRDIYNKDPKKN